LLSPIDFAKKFCYRGEVAGKHEAGQRSMTKAKKITKTSTRIALAQAVKDASFGWLGTAADLGLVALFLAAAGSGMHRGNANRIYGVAGKLFTSLRSKRLQKSLKHSLYHLIDSGYRSGWKVTSEGFKRLKRIMPHYIEDRMWDGWLYLVSYDIPENLKRSRENLRKALAAIDCGMIQDSVWVALSDPEPFIEDTIEMNELQDFVLILKTKPTGRARKNLLPILAAAYDLKNLNLRYGGFLELVKENKKPAEELGLRFLSILKDDPQLPFRLLPKDWQGDKAHQIYLKKVLPKMPNEYGQFISKLERIS
jgi:phenylacetic acid degradation operon negative regulatory protein